MKKLILISLLLISIFLIGSVDVFANGSCTYYTCDGRYKCGEEILDEFTECVDIHVYGDGYAELYGYWYYCELGGTGLGSSNKNFIGTCESWLGDLGANVQLRGNSMVINFYDVGEGCFVEMRCTLGGCTPEV